jgi:hypothetical protein
VALNQYQLPKKEKRSGWEDVNAAFSAAQSVASIADKAGAFDSPETKPPETKTAALDLDEIKQDPLAVMKRRRNMYA